MVAAQTANTRSSRPAPPDESTDNGLQSTTKYNQESVRSKNKQKRYRVDLHHQNIPMITVRKVRQNITKGHSDRRPNHADDHALQHKYIPYLLMPRPHARKDCNIFTLLHDGHNQSNQDV